MIEHIDIYYFKTVQIDEEVTVNISVLDMGRLSAKFEISMMNGNNTVAKALLMCQLLDK